MEDKYLNALYRIEEKSKHQLSMMSDKYNLLDELTRSMIYEEIITINDYLKLLEMFAIKYAEEEDRDAYEYTMIKMQMLVEAKRKKYKRTLFKGVDFQNRIDYGVAIFLSERKDYLSKRKEMLMKPFLYVSTSIYIVMLSLLVFVFHIPFLFAFLFSVLIWLFFLVYMVFSLLDEKILEEIEKNRSALGQAMDEFEVSRKNSSVSNLFHKFIKI